MNIIIAGAGTVGGHAAESLAAAGHNVTVIELDPARLRHLESTLDIRTFRANAAHADALREAGAPTCDMFVAATDHDEVNLLAASTAKGLGAKHCIARVHHSVYFDRRGLDYAQYFRIDSLICPEYATAAAIARTVRNPGAVAIEDFARGTIEMQQLLVSDDAPGLNTPLSELKLPARVRVATVTHGDRSFIPDATTKIQPGDMVTLLGEKSMIEAGRRMLQTEKITRKKVVIVGGTAMGVWLARALRQRHFAVRMFVTDHERAEALAEKLPHVTVLEAEPTEPAVFAEERIGEADALVALTEDDEHNILAAAQAKSLGVPTAVAVVQRSTYVHLLEHVGIDRAFSPGIVASREIQILLEKGPVRVLGSLVDVEADVYEIRVTDGAPVAGVALRELKLPGPCVIGGIQRGDQVYVPGADDKIEAGDVVLAIGRRGMTKKLRKQFASG